ncbi:MAG: hypothetical protein GY809_28280 [Planctomycetes bacterium]|nr:hypothetical protein [Planctomycetota bacterium]
MDNYDLANFDSDNGQVPPPAEDVSNTIPFDDSEPPAPVPPVSRKPLTLGANGSSKPQAASRPQGSAPRPAPRPAPRQVPRPASAQAAAVSKKVGQVVAKNTSRITGLKTFYTKLHPGALDFIDEQIAEWLKAHPSVNIKQTNVTVGEVQSKKTEPNIIINIWY